MILIFSDFFVEITYIQPDENEIVELISLLLKLDHSNEFMSYIITNVQNFENFIT